MGGLNLLTHVGILFAEYDFYSAVFVLELTFRGRQGVSELISQRSVEL